MDIKNIFKSRSALIVILVVFLVFLAVVISILNNQSTLDGANTESSGVASDRDSSTSGGKAVDTIAPEYSGGGVVDSTQDQKIIKTGSISMTVDDFDKSVADIKTIVSTNKGVVDALDDSGSDELRTVSITIRVPSAKFDSVMTAVKAIGVDVSDTKETSSDIAQTYMDLEARLNNGKALRTRLKQLLVKADKVADLIAIEKELSTTEQEIEYLQAQIRYYDAQVDMSSITIDLSINAESIDVSGEAWRPLGVMKEALQSVVLVLKSLGTLVIWIVIFSPFVLIPFGIYKLLTLKRKK